MTRQRRYGLVPALLLLPLCSTAQDKPVEIKPSLPKVVSASVPFYPELARETRIQGDVRLRVSTDGKRVSAINPENGHRLLVNAAKENVQTWQFAPHKATSFEVTFRYTLFIPQCDSECNCDKGERGEMESVVLHLPTQAEISAPTSLTCDPAVEIHRKRAIFARLFHLH